MLTVRMLGVFCVFNLISMKQWLKRIVTLWRLELACRDASDERDACFNKLINVERRHRQLTPIHTHKFCLFSRALPDESPDVHKCRIESSRTPQVLSSTCVREGVLYSGDVV